MKNDTDVWYGNCNRDAYHTFSDRIYLYINLGDKAWCNLRAKEEMTNEGIYFDN
jgi:hypothetical protein